MNCKNCEEKEAAQYSKYTSGEFCSKECARAYSTKNKRKEINEKVRNTLTGTGNGNIKIECDFCKKELELEWRKRNQKFCNNECFLKFSKEQSKILITKKCNCCKKEFKIKNKDKKRGKKFCSTSCALKERYKDPLFKSKMKENSRKGGLNSVQGKRSKNEIYFATLCKERFEKILMNEPIFNGWDADVIVEDFKIAVLWNGKWHYEKITKKHSVEQIQNRDKIKLKEITNYGYKPYVIKDMGKEDSEFVKKEFEKFLKYIAGWTGGGSSSVS